MTAEELGPLVTAGVNQQLEVAQSIPLIFCFLVSFICHVNFRFNLYAYISLTVLGIRVM